MQDDGLLGEPLCPDDGTVLRVDEFGWVCAWCGHREPLDVVLTPAQPFDGPGVRGG